MGEERLMVKQGGGFDGESCRGYGEVPGFECYLGPEAWGVSGLLSLLDVECL
jgi:hypothetical protein